MPIDETHNPLIHRINQAVKFRAVHPDQPLPETPAMLLRFASPPEDLIEKVQGRVTALVEAAEVKKGKHQIHMARSNTDDR
jgi:ATP-dependent DNA helicase 2 subunit 2